MNVSVKKQKNGWRLEIKGHLKEGGPQGENIYCAALSHHIQAIGYSLIKNKIKAEFEKKEPGRLILNINENPAIAENLIENFMDGIKLLKSRVNINMKYQEE